MAEFRVLPSIDELQQRPGVARLEARFGRHAVVTALRAGLESARAAVAAGDGAPLDRQDVSNRVEHDAESRLAALARGTLRRVVNATGVVVHTNLGRAPLADAAIARMSEVAGGFSTLEYDLPTGRRGDRAVHAERLLTVLTGAEAALVVNNNAAAVMLTLAALARGREVVVSRGELVEIGGGFRVPDVLAQSGAVLREVGTTNRTRVSDYSTAIGPATALVLRVHPSNFRIEGFTARPTLDELVGAARAASVPLVEDLGSGNLDPGLAEPTAQASLDAGVDLVCVSCDKMLGGPQAGVVLGRAALVDRLRRHPMMRALRVDKLTYAALEATLVEHWAGRARHTVPVLRMLHATADAIQVRAETLAARLRDGGWQADVVDGDSAIGGGSAHGVTLPTSLVRLVRPGWSAARLEQWLRGREAPVVARIHDDAVMLDLRTVSEDDEARLLAGLRTSDA